MEIINDPQNPQAINSQNVTPQYPQGAILPHSNMLVWSILITIFCCLVAGVIAIVFSAQSNSFYNQYLAAIDEKTKMNFYNESEKANKTAKTWIIVGLICGLCVGLLYAGLVILGVSTNLID